MWRVRLFRMRDEHPDQADHLLHGAVCVIEERALLVHREFVRVTSAGWHRFLADPRDAVLLNGQFQPVPVHGGALWECVFEYHAHAIALRDLNGWPGATTVVTPGIDCLERRDFLLHRFRF